MHRDTSIIEGKKGLDRFMFETFYDHSSRKHQIQVLIINALIFISIGTIVVESWVEDEIEKAQAAAYEIYLSVRENYPDVYANVRGTAPDEKYSKFFEELVQLRLSEKPTALRDNQALLLIYEATANAAPPALKGVNGAEIHDAFRRSVAYWEKYDPSNDISQLTKLASERIREIEEVDGDGSLRKLIKEEIHDMEYEGFFDEEQSDYTLASFSQHDSYFSRLHIDQEAAKLRKKVTAIVNQLNMDLASVYSQVKSLESDEKYKEFFQEDAFSETTHELFRKYHAFLVNSDRYPKEKKLVEYADAQLDRLELLKMEQRKFKAMDEEFLRIKNFVANKDAFVALEATFKRHNFIKYSILTVVDKITLLFFLVEYFAVCYVSWPKIGVYTLSVNGIIDAMAILPSLIEPLVKMIAAGGAGGLGSLQIIKTLRLLRLMRLLRMLKVAASVMDETSEKTEQERKDAQVALNFVIAMMFLGMCLIMVSALIVFFERDAQPDAYPHIWAAMWWGIITLTTVGYGDVSPITAAGKVTAGVAGLLSVAVFALLLGAIASFVEDFMGSENENGGGTVGEATLSPPEQLEKFEELRKQGVISDEEFSAQKTKLLS